MSLTIFLCVLAAAILHAAWNGLVKGTSDKALGMAAIVVFQGVFGAFVLPFVAVPDPASWPYLIAGVALHIGYQLFLMTSYRFGDLTQVYPIARGTAPLLVALVSVAFLGVALSRLELVAVVVIGAGIMSLSLVRRSDGQRNGRAAALAFVTGCFIAAYSLIDGIGARVAGTALGFYGWLTVGNFLVFVAVAMVWRPALILGLPKVGQTLVVGGGASFVAYALVIYAFTQAPIALVTALRETSIVFALFIGVFFLKERFDLAKLVAIMVTLFGAALLRLGRG